MRALLGSSNRAMSQQAEHGLKFYGCAANPLVFTDYSP